MKVKFGAWTPNSTREKKQEDDMSHKRFELGSF